MINEKTTELVKRFLEDKIGCEININDDLQEIEGYDSLMIVELILYIEETFDIEIPEDYYALENYTSIEAIIETLRKI